MTLTTGSVRRPSDLYAYPSMVAEHGFNNIGRHFFLTYMYIPPGQDFTQRYLVMHEASIAVAPTPQRPQVRTALSDGRVPMAASG